MKVLFTLLLVFSTASLFGDTIMDWSFYVRPSWSGAWFNADQSGHGISVEVLDDERTIFFWYTYDLEGNPVWLVADGVNSDLLLTGMLTPFIRVEATAYIFEGMIFGDFDPATMDHQEWGTIILDFPYWACNVARMEWFPTMEGFAHGSTDLERLTSLYELDCVDMQDKAGNWEVQLDYDAEVKYQIEIVALSNPEPPDSPELLSFEFLDESNCLWSGQLQAWGIRVEANWRSQCEATTVGHSDNCWVNFEHNLCDSENECTRKDEVMIFEDEGEYLIFSR
jgi:hypothetical protein